MSKQNLKKQLYKKINHYKYKKKKFTKIIIEKYRVKNITKNIDLIVNGKYN